jgi:hypothetical protein
VAKSAVGSIYQQARSLALIAFWPAGLAELLSAAVWYNPQ